MRKTDAKRGKKRGSGRNRGMMWRKEMQKARERVGRSCDHRTAPPCICNHNIKMIPENNPIILLFNLTSLDFAFCFIIYLTMSASLGASTQICIISQM